MRKVLKFIGIILGIIVGVDLTQYLGIYIYSLLTPGEQVDGIVGYVLSFSFGFVILVILVFIFIGLRAIWKSIN